MARTPDQEGRAEDKRQADLAYQNAVASETYNNPPQADQNSSSGGDTNNAGGGTPVRRASRGTVGGGGGASVAAAVATPSIDPETLAAEYGFTVGFLKAYPELNALFNQAVSGNWSASRFEGALRSTKWYQSMSDTQRKALVMQYTDPASYQKALNDATDHMKVLAAQMGVDPNDSTTMNIAATKVVNEGWSDEQARNWLGYQIHFDNAGLAGGEAGKEVDALNSYAYQMGVKNADWWVRQNVMGIVRGATTEEDAKNQIMEIAMAQFPQYADQIKSGMTVESLAQPYMQSMQKILEIPGGQVNLFDPTIRNVMSYKDPSGNGQQKPLWQFENDLRQDPRWGKTQNAQDSAMGAAHTILRDFGLYS